MATSAGSRVLCGGARATSSRVDCSTWGRHRRLRQNSFWRGDKPFTLSLFTRRLVTPAHSFGPFADTPFGGFFVSSAPFHFTKDAFTLQPLLEHSQGLIDIVVFDKDAQSSSDLKVAATPRPQCVRLFERSGVTPEKPDISDAHGFPSCATVKRLSPRQHIATTTGPHFANGKYAAEREVQRSG